MGIDPIVASSDLGSYGVPHGRGLIDELLFLRRVGFPIEAVLVTASSVPRQRRGCERADIHPGCHVDLIALAGSPFADIEHLRNLQTVLRGSSRMETGRSSVSCQANTANGLTPPRRSFCTR